MLIDATGTRRQSFRVFPVSFGKFAPDKVRWPQLGSVASNTRDLMQRDPKIRHAQDAASTDTKPIGLTAEKLVNSYGLVPIRSSGPVTHAAITKIA